MICLSRDLSKALLNCLIIHCLKVKRPTKDVLAISAPNYLQRKSEQKNDAGNSECEGSKAKRYCKTHVMTAIE